MHLRASVLRATSSRSGRAQGIRFIQDLALGVVPEQPVYRAGYEGRGFTMGKMAHSVDRKPRIASRKEAV
jgi:hypothetical protein